MSNVFKLLSSMIIVILLIAIYGTYGLVHSEWTVGNLCPKIIGVPACYIVFVLFILSLISHIVQFKNSSIYFFVFIGLITLIAITGTLGELTGFSKCPRTSSGIPMCFISLVICLITLSSKFILVRRK